MKRYLAGLLCLSLCAGILTGCTRKEKPYVPTGDGLTWDEDYTGPVYTHPDQEEQALMLTYYPDRSMNPYLCTDYTNRALFSLLYQSLFVTDRDYRTEPQLCKTYTITEDQRRYDFYLEPDATFSDGTPLTPEDVAASLLAAKESDYYGGRFTYIGEVAVTEEGGVNVSCTIPVENLPLLLDIPIIKQTQLQEEFPLGTGPYVLNVQDSSLQKRENWWCSPAMVITDPSIPLLEAQSITQIRDAFEFSDLSIVCADPGSDQYADYRCDFELWDCENGVFLYLTACKKSKVLSHPEIRKAITYAIDRELLAEQFYRGFARGASLPASPLFPYYSQSLAEKYAYHPEKFAEAVKHANLRDNHVVLLVNKDDSLRLRVARAIAGMLEAGGLEVEMSELGSREYIRALKSWKFDLCLGQTKLSPNMDLSAFFAPYGTLSWGGVNDPAAYALNQQALENHGNYYTLHQTVMDNGLMCPVLFRSYAVFATRGLVTGLTPSRDSVFYYSLGKTMEKALQAS